MPKIKCMVAAKNKVIHDGIALILGSCKNINIIGSRGVDVVKEALALQPDVLVYELDLGDNNHLEVLTTIKKRCCWTKLILFSDAPPKKEMLQQYLCTCDGYMQGPLLPGYLLKSLELACYSGYFFFLGFARDIRLESTQQTQYATPNTLFNKH